MIFLKTKLIGGLFPKTLSEIRFKSHSMSILIISEIENRKQGLKTITNFILKF